MTRSRLSPSSLAVILGVLTSSTGVPVASAQDKPQAIPAPGIKKVDDLPEEAQQNVSTDNLPTAEAVLKKYVDAIGGEPAIRARKSVVIKGQMEDFTSNIVTPFEIHRAAPDLMLMVVDRPQGKRSGGHDGKTTWAFDATVGPQIFGPPTEDSAPNFDFYRDLNYATNFDRVEVTQKEDFDGRPCYRVWIVSKAGREFFEFYDAQTGLRAGTSNTFNTQRGRIRNVEVFDEYKDFAGLKLPTRIATKSWGRGRQGNLTQMMTYESVEFDKADPAVFELPPEVQSLWNDEQQKAREEAAENAPAPAPAPK